MVQSLQEEVIQILATIRHKTSHVNDTNRPVLAIFNDSFLHNTENITRHLSLAKSVSDHIGVRNYT